MYGEMHVMVGMTMGAGAMHFSPEKWWIVVPLAIMSHWPLDDLNIGKVARMWHGTSIFQYFLRFFIAAGLLAATIGYWWEIPLVGFIAWLSFDHEWVVNLIPGKHGYGLHRNMWMEWMYTKKGFWPFFVACILFLWMML